MAKKTVKTAAKAAKKTVKTVKTTKKAVKHTSTIKFNHPTESKKYVQLLAAVKAAPNSTRMEIAQAVCGSNVPSSWETWSRLQKDGMMVRKAARGTWLYRITDKGRYMLKKAAKNAR